MLENEVITKEDVMFGNETKQSKRKRKEKKKSLDKVKRRRLAIQAETVSFLFNLDLIFVLIFYIAKS